MWFIAHQFTAKLKRNLSFKSGTSNSLRRDLDRDLGRQIAAADRQVH
jgi:hypothetical protein